MLGTPHGIAHRKGDFFMVTETVTVVNPMGFHMRPATLFSQTAQKFQSSVKLLHNGKEFDGKSLMHLMAAGLKCGSELTLRCDGPDEVEALKATAELISSGLGE